MSELPEERGRASPADPLGPAVPGETQPPSGAANAGTDAARAATADGSKPGTRQRRVRILRSDVGASSPEAPGEAAPSGEAPPASSEAPAASPEAPSAGTPEATTAAVPGSPPHEPLSPSTGVAPPVGASSPTGPPDSGPTSVPAGETAPAPQSGTLPLTLPPRGGGSSAFGRAFPGTSAPDLPGPQGGSASGQFLFSVAQFATSPQRGEGTLLDADRLTQHALRPKTRKLTTKRLERASGRLDDLRDGIPAIAVKNLVASYGTQRVLHDVSFAVKRGEILAILGGSGSGKTTLLKHLIGLIQPDGGSIEIAGQDIARLEGDDLAMVLRTIGMLFQYSALFNSITVGENVGLPLREYTDLPDDAIRSIVRLKLALVGLPGIEGKLPGELSGGMKKRAALARAVALDPDCLFFDEPASGLDPIAAADLDQLILHLNRAFGTTMVIVTHDLENAFNVAHRILMLDRGRIAALGTPEAIRASEDPWVRGFLARKSGGRDALDEEFFVKLESRRIGRKKPKEANP